MRAKLKECIELKDDEKLNALLQTIDNFFAGKIEQPMLDDARKKLNAWKLEKKLIDFTNKADLTNDELEELRSSITLAESDEYKSEIRPEVVIEAKKRLRRAEGKKVMLK